MSQDDAAKAMGILRTSLVNIEYGRQNINIAQIERFARIYASSMAAILA